MAERFDMSHQQSVAQTEPNLSELKKEVEITPSTLKDITNKEQFLERVVELSINAKDSINIQRTKQALVYLTEAQKILQYAASCGKTIDKYIIISVLHNEACCYQKIWQLQKCSQYLQALIFNFNSFMKTQDGHQLDDSSTLKNIKNKKIEDRFANDVIDCKTFLAKYYLQFCAVNSQTDNHSGALVAGRKSIQILRSIFRDMAELAPSLKKGTYEKKTEFDYKIKLIDMASRLNDSLNVAHYETLFHAAKYYLKQWKMMKDNKDRADRNYILEEQFKNYSIGNAMQIVPIDHKQFQDRQSKNYSAKTVLEKILLMALGYFTISTELRLIATKKYGKKENEKANSHQYRESELYHLLSIVIASSCIPFEILYIKHVLSSYNNHYGNDLLVEDSVRGKGDNYQDFLFPPLVKQRKQTITNSFTASMDHEQTISKFQKEETLQHSSQNEIQSEKKKEEMSRMMMDQSHNQFAKRAKNSHKNKSSKSKSKNHFKAPTLGDKSQKASPMPKSPNAHIKSPKSNLIKVKTSYKLKVSAEKIVTTNNLMGDKSKKKKQPKNENPGQFEYFMGKSKDLKKMKKTVESNMNMPSPRPNSRSSSKRQSPVPRYFDYTKSPQAASTKHLKSPKRQTGSKNIKNNLHQHYL